jgi:hypothetical protein
MQAMTKLAQHNMQLWADMQKNFFKAADFGNPDRKKK